jgi:hypothetical protein
MIAAVRQRDADAQITPFCKIRLDNEVSPVTNDDVGMTTCMHFVAFMPLIHAGAYGRGRHD